MENGRQPAHGGTRGAIVILVLLTLGMLGVLLWAHTWKSGLTVSQVRVEGNQIVPSAEILAAAGIQQTEKLFNVDLYAAQRRVEANHFLKSVSIRREIPGRIMIAVVERLPLAAVAIDRMLYVDDEGYVLPPLHSESIFDIPVLTGSFGNGDVQTGRRVTSEPVKEALSVLRLAQQIDEQLYRKISEVHVEGKKDLVLYTADGGVPVIIGHTTMGVKLVKLYSFWKQFVDRRGAGELQYIDLRFEDQIIVRWNNNKGESNTTRGATQRETSVKGKAT